MRHSWEARCRLVQLILFRIAPRRRKRPRGLRDEPGNRVPPAGAVSRRAAGRRCATARRSPGIVLTASRPRPRRRSWGCVGVVKVAARRRWRPCSADRPRRSGGSSSATASRAPPPQPRPVVQRYRYRRLARWCTSTARSWAASGRSASASWTTACSAAVTPAGSACTSPSTITHVWPGHPDPAQRRRRRLRPLPRRRRCPLRPSSASASSA